MQTPSPAPTQTHAITRTGTAMRDVGRTLTIVLFLLPALALFTVFVVYPVFQAAYYSVWKWNGLGPLKNFVGIENYISIVNDKVFLTALKNNLFILVLSLVLQLPFSLGLALMVGRRLRGRAFFRLIFFLPYVLSEVITGLIWSFIYNPDFGLLNTFIKFVNPAFEGAVWLGYDTVMPAIFAVITWKFFGFHLMLYVAGLQEIPPEIEEAALIDGATGGQAIRYVTLPMLGSTIRLSVYLSVLGSLQFFDLIWVMTLGGPVNASETMATYMVKFGFQKFQLSYGSAVAVILFLLCLGFSLVYQRFVMRRDVAGAVTGR
jgi:raffinose/stachyose/melibiose transport system permease protein